jgi:S-formylglutathione hydrolase FrmB
MEIGPKWETSLIRDLIGYVDRVFQTKATRESRCVGGLSMGGYGAIKLAVKYPDIFSSAVSHSGALCFAHRPNVPTPEEPWRVEFARIAGENPQGGPNDIFALAEKVPVEKRPALRIDCGVEDFLIEDNRACHAHLEKIGYPHEYAEFPGAHTWDYWDVHVQEAIAFHARNLGLKAAE